MGGPRWALAAALGPTGVAPARLPRLIPVLRKPCLLPKGGAGRGGMHHLAVHGLVFSSPAGPQAAPWSVCCLYVDLLARELRWRVSTLFTVYSLRCEMPYSRAAI